MKVQNKLDETIRIMAPTGHSLVVEPDQVVECSALVAKIAVKNGLTLVEGSFAEAEAEEVVPEKTTRSRKTKAE